MSRRWPVSVSFFIVATTLPMTRPRIIGRPLPFSCRGSRLDPLQLFDHFFAFLFPFVDSPDFGIEVAMTLIGVFCRKSAQARSDEEFLPPLISNLKFQISND